MAIPRAGALIPGQGSSTTQGAGAGFGDQRTFPEAKKRRGWWLEVGPELQW